MELMCVFYEVKIEFTNIIWIDVMLQGVKTSFIWLLSTAVIPVVILCTLVALQFVANSYSCLSSLSFHL
jgi:hypothetical protein